MLGHDTSLEADARLHVGIAFMLLPLLVHSPLFCLPQPISVTASALKMSGIEFVFPTVDLFTGQKLSVALFGFHFIHI